MVNCLEIVAPTCFERFFRHKFRGFYKIIVFLLSCIALCMIPRNAKESDALRVNTFSQRYT